MTNANEHDGSMLTRRASILGAGVLTALFASAASADPEMVRVVPNPENRSRTYLHQDETFSGPPARVYRVLLSGREFAAFSGERAQIDPRVGGAFSLFNGQVVGRNVDLVPNRRIVQAWRAVGDWPPGIYSLVHFELAPTSTGTQLALDHTGFQEGDFDHLNAGWAPHYWDPMRRYFESHR